VTVSERGTFSFTGLAAGASEARSFDCKNDSSAVADANNEVAESDETNNSRLAPGTHCIT
jgi:subtilase family serine protease